MLEAAELAGTVFFAVSGTFVVAHRPLDWFGAVVVAVVTAVGGGTIRGLILGITPVFWVEDEKVLIFALAGGMIAIPAVRLIESGSAQRLTRAVLVADAAGLALFTVVGAEIALDAGFGAGTAVVAGLVTGVGGGVIRDILAGQTPLILRSDIYATAALAGVLAYVGAERLAAEQLAAVVGGVIIFGVRMGAIRHGWSLPAFGRPTPERLT
jgi:uncharacterized membrane protein YeiH